MGQFSWRFVVAFSILLTAFAVATVMSVYLVTAAHAEAVPLSPPVVNITDDPGGNVGVYYRKYQALNAAGAEIHFHGLCASACTLVLFKSFSNIRACADENAIFGFHQPFEEHDGKIKRTKAAVRDTRKLWAAWLQELPDRLQKYLQRVRVPSATEGDETNTMLMLPATLLLPRCSVSVATS